MYPWGEEKRRERMGGKKGEKRRRMIKGRGMNFQEFIPFTSSSISGSRGADSRKKGKRGKREKKRKGKGKKER